MPDASEHFDRSWLLEPLGPNEVRIHVDLGEGADVSPELRTALDTLVRELHASEVEGFAEPAPCPDLAACGHYNCNPLGRCTSQWKRPCYWDEGCRVADFRVL